MLTYAHADVSTQSGKVKHEQRLKELESISMLTYADVRLRMRMMRTERQAEARAAAQGAG